MARKRAAGAGRKPVGNSSGVVTTIRLEPDLKHFLEVEADKHGRGLAEEIRRRLKDGTGMKADTQNLRDLFHLMERLSERIGMVAGKSWSSDPFRAEAFRVAVDQIIRRMSPEGESSVPPDMRDFYFSFHGQAKGAFLLAAKTAESTGNDAAMSLWTSVTSTDKASVAERRIGNPRLASIRLNLKRKGGKL